MCIPAAGKKRAVFVGGYGIPAVAIANPAVVIANSCSNLYFSCRSLLRFASLALQFSL